MIRCPKCQGSTWDPDGGDCKVCQATGALRENGEFVDYETAAEYIRRLDEQQPRRRF